MRPNVLLLALLFISMNVLADKPIAPAAIPGTTLINAEQLVDLIAATPELVIVDARRHEEFVKGHIEGAIYMLDTEMTAEKLGAAVRAKTSPVVFYCNGERCSRSSNAALKALSWGYHRIYWFRGGWQEWKDKNLPISR